MIPGDWSWWDQPITWHTAAAVYGWYMLTKVILSLVEWRWRRVTETPHQRVGRRMGAYGRALRRERTGR